MGRVRTRRGLVRRFLGNLQQNATPFGKFGRCPCTRLSVKWLESDYRTPVTGQDDVLAAFGAANELRKETLGFGNRDVHWLAIIVQKSGP